MDGDVQVPSENTNTATIARTPRTKDTSTTDDTQIPNTAPKPIDGGTFKLVPYASGKKVFSRDAKHSGAETFKVDGYNDWLNSNQASDSTSYTGLQLTGDGLVIRFGENGKQYPDTKQKLDTAIVTDNAASDVGENGWDLTITFDGPDTLSAEKGVRSRQGNGDFYWKARVETVASQRRAGANCVDSVLTADNQDVEDIGTYEVWLSNHIGVDTNLEDPNDPVASARDDDVVRLPLLPPPIIRLPRICPLSRATGASPASAAACSPDIRPSSGISATGIEPKTKSGCIS